MFENALRSVLIARESYSGDVEIIVVNSSKRTVVPAATPQVAEIHAPNVPEASQKRNIGLSQASKDWVVFLDDDCQMAPRALEIIGEHVAKADNRSVGFFGITKFVGPKTYWFTALEGTDYLACFEWAYKKEDLDWGPTSLAVFSKLALQQVGGFSPAFTRMGGEDIDLCVRLRDTGAKLTAIPAVLALHSTETWNDIYQNLQRMFQYGMGIAQLQVRYPTRNKFDFNSPILLAVPVVLLLTLVSLTNQFNFIGLRIILILLLAILFGLVLEERLRARRPILQVLVVLLHHLAYRLGIAWALTAKRRFKFLFTYFSWPADPSERASRGKFPTSSLLVAFVTLVLMALLLRR